MPPRHMLFEYAGSDTEVVGSPAETLNTDVSTNFATSAAVRSFGMSRSSGNSPEGVSVGLNVPLSNLSK